MNGQQQPPSHFLGKKSIKVAFVGNPNSGKSTLFNALTGLNQRTGNFPGVTVDKKIGIAKLSASVTAEFIDLPGTYSLYPKSLDERVAFNVLCNTDNPDHPDITVVIADASNLKRNLFLASQIIDLKIPVILALNMMDMVEKDGIVIDTVRLSEKLGIKVIGISARNREGLDALKLALLEPLPIPAYDFIDVKKIASEAIEKIKNVIPVTSDFDAFLLINGFLNFEWNDKNQERRTKIAEALSTLVIDTNQLQSTESVERYKIINRLVEDCVTHRSAIKTKSFTEKLDGILTHRIWGYLIFLGILFLIFQTIFFLAAFPMEWIESLFVFITNWGANVLPAGVLTDLLLNGIVAGLSGIVVFVPQIALLFTFISILEDTGYMARVSFIMDKMMRKFGLNGRSVIPLISGVACAVPAIMSARTISNWKERIITIMVTPLMSCSARLPVYTLLISLVVPDNKTLGFFNYQGLILMALYLIGFIAAIISALVMKWILKAREKSYFIMELPVYRSPQWRTIALTIYDKVKMFLWDAGKIIVAISIVLWFLTSHAPNTKFEQIDAKYSEAIYTKKYTEEELQSKIASEKLEESYAGMLGKYIEPAIKPLGFDWKIGISLITSFAAREVFVGTMATIYSAGNADNTLSIRAKMKAEINPDTGLPRYTLAVGFSLMIFYAFAMQCMSTLAVVYRETKSWKWPAIQFLFMSVLAYVSSLIIYQTLK
ncbi:MAG: ferrous iron transport protein B [Bacteroidia bacterium]